MVSSNFVDHNEKLYLFAISIINMRFESISYSIKTNIIAVCWSIFSKIPNDLIISFLNSQNNINSLLEFIELIDNHREEFINIIMRLFRAFETNGTSGEFIQKLSLSKHYQELCELVEIDPLSESLFQAIKNQKEKSFPTSRS